ncbi:MAG TPA: helix-turn-helix domain-containing protein [Kofleriaceae bacterium]
MAYGIGGHDELLSTGAAAQLLGSCRQHVVDMCSRGDLPYVWVGRHRRIRKSAIASIARHEREELTRDQERSLWLHRAVLAQLMSRPTDVLDLARQNALRVLQQQHRVSMTSSWLEQWLRILDNGVDDVAETLTSRASLAVELRQNSPFAGVLPQDTRSKVLAAFAQHWREEHGSHSVDVRRRTSTPSGD